ncbi:hypothetical protein I5677_00930 [Mobilitalea sibirica]|uniref:SpoIIAA-like protein n=1 Tax=Mobilitalea sibirica TaxID=1462919 RepID=A0A8J7H0C0_9FIRM|nr:hypothetical protein [Mobilitalea sibirica]MBH1939452.1 hypothetical protein [Mobilitalea sibirica]
MSRINTVTHIGKKVFYFDYSGCMSSELPQIISEANELIKKEKEGTVLTLTNVEGMHFNKDVISLFKEQTASTKQYVKASALIGLGGLHRIALDAVTRFSRADIKVFQDKSEALNWLTIN